MMKGGTDDGSIPANLFESVPSSGRFDFEAYSLVLEELLASAVVHDADQHASAAVRLAVDAHRAKQFELVLVVLVAVDVGDPSSAEAGPRAAVEFRDFVSHVRFGLRSAGQWSRPC